MMCICQSPQEPQLKIIGGTTCLFSCRNDTKSVYFFSSWNLRVDCVDWTSQTCYYLRIGLLLKSKPGKLYLKWIFDNLWNTLQFAPKVEKGKQDVYLVKLGRVVTRSSQHSIWLRNQTSWVRKSTLKKNLRSCLGGHYGKTRHE